MVVNAPPQDCYVRVGSVNTRYRTQGTEGSPVLLMHGIGSSLEDWAANIAPLATRHRVYALDLVGNGRSDKPDAEYSLPYFGDFVADFLRTQGIDRVSLVGNSMGGGVALDVAIRYPQLVDRLVLVDPGGLGREVTILFRLLTLPLIGERLARPTLKGTEQFLQSFVYDPALITPELVQFQYELACLPGALEALLSTLRRNVNLLGLKPGVVRHYVANLNRVTSPTLVIWGREDKTLPVAQAEVARKGIPNAQVHILEKCAHVPMIERPAEFNELVSKFLD